MKETGHLHPRMYSPFSEILPAKGMKQRLLRDFSSTLERVGSPLLPAALPCHSCATVLALLVSVVKEELEVTQRGPAML